MIVFATHFTVRFADSVLDYTNSVIFERKFLFVIDKRRTRVVE